MSAPDSGAGEDGQACAVPAIAVFEVADAAFAAGAPFDEPSERGALLVFSAVGAGGAFARDGDPLDAEFVELGFDAGLAIAAIRGDGAGNSAGAVVDAANRWLQLRSVDRVAFFDVVVQDDAVGVVDDLGLNSRTRRAGRCGPCGSAEPAGRAG
ncbi:hypothetical protein Raf01_71030 [Rugosimonospora africana]|uniref:Uncharacterized protein n=1 Tax=Rugosimonospora africana TaxID=556532 RepID=A0A8J3QYM8_9ACTN|nr:hypothetical protein Raf01_71030 [Rugosimonospora africana]